MKILILTYFKETNPGTFLQAFGVQYALKKIFKQAQIEFLNVGPVIKESEEKLPKKEVYMSIEKLIHYYSLYRRKKKHEKLIKQCFKQTSQVVNFFGENVDTVENIFNQYDYIVIGSDTILESISINGSPIGIMWPSLEISSSKIYFSASAGSCRDNYRKSTFFSELHNRVSDFSYIGLRDEITIDFFTEKLGINSKRIVKQPDPTFHLPLSLFKISKKHEKIFKGKKNIVLYHLDRRFKFRKQLTEKLRDKGYFLVSPEYDPSVNVSMYALDPFEWAALFNFCDYIITERFHDTVFGMRYAKSIIPINWGDSYINTKGESKLLSIARDFAIDSNYISIRSYDDIFKVTEKLDFLKKSNNKTILQARSDEMNIKAEQILQKIKAIIES